MTRLKEIEARLTEINETINTRGAELSADELTEFETEVANLITERNSLQATPTPTAGDATIEQRNRLLSAIAAGNPVGGATPKVVRSFAPTNGAEIAPEDRYDTMQYRRAFMAHVLRGTAIPTEYRADATSTTTDVGAVIPTTVLNKIVEELEATGMVLPRVTRTAYKGGLAIPVSTVKPVATWVNEGAGSDKQKNTVSKNGMITFAYHKLRCAVALTLEVDTMALAAFEAMLIRNIVEAMTKALEQAIINGDGTGKPKGILSETPKTGQAITSTSNAKLTYADIIAVESALPQAYESGAEWFMSKSTFLSFIGMTDEAGQPIARVNYGISGKPERVLLGRPVICGDYLGGFTAASAGDVVAFVFKFADYVLNTNYTMGVKKYEDHATDDIVTKSIMLVDGKVIDKGSLVTLKKAAASA